jgi:dihydrofolate reductase
MRKVVLQMVVSLDGYVAGPNGDLSWVFPGLDDDVRRWIVDSLSGIDTQLLGRVAYSEQEGYWPTATEELAPLMNESTKIVFASTLDKLGWSNSRLAEGSPAEEIARLKQEPGKDIYVPGGASFAQSLSAQGLIDEYRLIVNPVVLGGGLPLFTEPVNLKLLDSRAFGTGAVVLVYEPAKSADG